MSNSDMWHARSHPASYCTFLTQIAAHGHSPFSHWSPHNCPHQPVRTHLTCNIRPEANYLKSLKSMNSWMMVLGTMHNWPIICFSHQSCNLSYILSGIQEKVFPYRIQYELFVTLNISKDLLVELLDPIFRQHMLNSIFRWKLTNVGT